MGMVKVPEATTLADELPEIMPKLSLIHILIALNEYVMQPGCGFNMHPHEDVEQIFLVLEGQLSYADSLGNEGVLSPGGAQ